MSCSNCYNNCPEVTSDRCVKYTGVDVPVLQIKTGDSLSYVEQALVEFLTSTLDGSGIKLELDPAVICTLVKNNLPTCGDLTLVDLSNTLVKSICDLQTQVSSLAGIVYNINSPYTTGCLTGVSGTSLTHDVLQATINKLCQLDSNVASLTTNMSQYVKLSDLCQLVTACITAASGGTGTKYYTKMVPFTVVEYYGSLSNFDADGAGIGDWENIYLCNGMTFKGTLTPDKRGRVGVGVINMAGTIPLDNEVSPFAINPPNSFNTQYTLRQKAGANSVQLAIGQIPAHNHTFTGTPAPHKHSLALPLAVEPMRSASSGTIINVWKQAGSSAGQTYDTLDTNVTPLGVTVDNGGNQYHDNKQPAIACYYIMYIP